MRRYEHRAVLITAGAGAIGRASALRMAAEGARVALCDIDAAALAACRDAGAAAGATIETVEADLLDPMAIARAVAQVERRFGRIDVLVNNAGGSMFKPHRFLEQSDRDWKDVFDLNLQAAVWTTRAVLPGMRARRYGRIVNLGSKAGRFGSLIAGAGYAAAKGAIVAMTRQLAIEFGPDGITVNCVSPGVVATERTRKLWNARYSVAEQAEILGRVPLRRRAEVDDVAAAIAFFGSDDAAFVTGTVLDVNGGEAMGG
jgi:3-oxoacyl-[acyl-carrier protein] reductase/2-hydroxycyclohexanecarboxyl-CoA dehydrogenase